MFVRASKYHELQVEFLTKHRKYTTLLDKYNGLLDEWNDLINEINAKGGEAFLKGKNQPTQFTDEEIKKLLILCHPDKHNGKPLATEMTALLNKLKGN